MLMRLKFIFLIVCLCLLRCNAENKNTRFLLAKQHGGKRRSTTPILLYQNHCATFNIILSGGIETNQGPVTCTFCEKSVRKNSHNQHTTIYTKNEINKNDTVGKKYLYKFMYKKYSHLRTSLFRRITAHQLS